MEEIIELTNMCLEKYGQHIELRFNKDNGVVCGQIHDWWKEQDVFEFYSFEELRNHLNS